MDRHDSGDVRQQSSHPIGHEQLPRPAFEPRESGGNIASVLSRANALYLGVAAAVILIALSARHLTSQGAHYDELHQAPASFEYLGHHSAIFDYAPHGSLS